jgi:hypothetical protein
MAIVDKKLKKDKAINLKCSTKKTLEHNLKNLKILGKKSKKNILKRYRWF